MADSLPVVLLLSLMKQPFYDKMENEALQALGSKAVVQEALNTAEALQRLSAASPFPPPDIIILRDPALGRLTLEEDHRYGDLESDEPVDIWTEFEPETDATLARRKLVLERVADYARAGGTVVAGMQFCGDLPFGDNSTRFFSEGFGLPWKVAAYTNRTTKPSKRFRSNVLSLATISSVPEFTMKGLYLQDVSPEQALYTDVYHVKESPVCFAPLGEGYFGFLGDVNSEKETRLIMLALCGLSGGSPRSPPKDWSWVEPSCHWFGCDGKPRGGIVCPYCNDVVYCSSRCEERDWTRGGHRKICRKEIANDM